MNKTISIVLWFIIIIACSYLLGWRFLIGLILGVVYMTYLLRNNDTVRFWVLIDKHTLKAMTGGFLK